MGPASLTPSTLLFKQWFKLIGSAGGGCKRLQANFTAGGRFELAPGPGGSPEGGVELAPGPGLEPWGRG